MKKKLFYFLCVLHLVNPTLVVAGDQCSRAKDRCIDLCDQDRSDSMQDMESRSNKAFGDAAAGMIAGYAMGNKSEGLERLRQAQGEMENNAESYKGIDRANNRCESQCERQEDICYDSVRGR